MNYLQHSPVEIWGGVECTINRVQNRYFNQLDYSGHFERGEDISLFSNLGLKKLRFPILWEKHQPLPGEPIDWSQTAERLTALSANNISIIAGLVHHGSGPAFVDIMRDDFAEGLGVYAGEVASKFPWIEYYTPVNEPLTTARFCGLYGVWYPHLTNDQSFCRILINECKGTVLAMQAIRKVNPAARLVQTDDLGKIHSTPLLKYQADFENERRWLGYDLLCGKVDSTHPLYHYLTGAGITCNDLQFFVDNVCKPDVIGCNHYLTSERYLDENTDRYPPHTHGGNGTYTYADVEAVRVGNICPDGPYKLLTEAWERYGLPIAVTEVHLFCTREEQMRWLRLIWETATKLKNDGVDILAITPWALLGSYGWNQLLTREKGDYEPGVFDLTNGYPRATVLAKMVKAYSNQEQFNHPVLDNDGWWQRKCRVIYGNEAFYHKDVTPESAGPLLIIGKTGAMGNAFARACDLRGIKYHLSGKNEVDITSYNSLKNALITINPWAVVNTAGFMRIHDAETDSGSCFAINAHGPEQLALLCRNYGVKLLTFSSDFVFDGMKVKPYKEDDELSPLNIYGKSKAIAERTVLEKNHSALIIRTSAFFGPWDNNNFISQTIADLKKGAPFASVNDVMVSPTYLPDLANASLDLLLDGERGIWHLTNDGQISWADLAFTVAERKGLNTSLIIPRPLKNFGFKAQIPRYSVLSSNRGILLPSLSNAIDRCLHHIS